MKLPTLLKSALLGTVLVFAGCAHTEVYEADQAPDLIIVDEYASFYQEGPLQQRGPDLSLRLNDRVKLLKKDFTGYALVEISDGRRGYVAAESLAPAPPLPTEPAEPKPHTRSGSGVDPVYTGPQNNEIPLPDMNAPLPDLNVGPEDAPAPAGPSMIDPEPTPETKPKFRY